MNCIRWFQKAKIIVKCKHSKKIGEKFPSNLVHIFEFSQFKSCSLLPYGIVQCTECGYRGYTQLYLHMMPESMTKVIDDFINYKVSREHFIEFLQNKMAHYKILDSEVGLEPTSTDSKSAILPLDDSEMGR